MKRPSFQFYPDDWSGNSNLKRCTHEEKGIWMDVLCVLHDQDEYGVVRWPLAELAQAAGTTKAKLKRLVEKGVLKGVEEGQRCEALVYVPRSGRKNGPPVTLIAEQEGPLWYSSRMVTDEHKRHVRGGFDDSSKGPPDPAPNPPFGDGFDGAPMGSPDPSPLSRARGQAPRAAPSSPSPSSIKEKEDAAAAIDAAQESSRSAMPANPRESAPPPLSPGDSPRKPNPVSPEVRVAVLIRGWEKARGKASGINANNPHVSAWVEAGVPDELLREAYELAVAKREKAADPSALNAGYLDRFVAEVMNPPAGTSAVGKAKARAGDPLAWALTWSGIEAKALELGLTRGRAESEPAFKQRVHAAAGMTSQDAARLLADHGVHVRHAATA